MATTSTFQVSLTANDGNWIYNEFFEEFGFSNTECKLNTDNISQKVFLLFNNVTIPKGATILSAQLQIYPTAKSGFPTTIFYSFQTVDNAVAPTTYNEAQSYSSIATTPITDSFADSEIVLSSWLNSKTTSMASSLQQITSRTGWNYGNSILMFLTADAGLTLNDYTTSGTYAAKLVVTHTGTTVTYQPTASGSDGNEANDATFDNSSTTMIVGDAGWGKICSSFVLFSSVNIPQGATIGSATIETNNALINSAVLVLYSGHKVSNAVAPTTYAQYESYYSAKTTATVSDTISANGWKTSPDVKTIIQEIVNQSSWISGNSILIFIHDNGNAPWTWNGTQITTFDGTPANSTKLNITFATPNGFENRSGDLKVWQNGDEAISYTGTGSGQTNMYKDSASGDFLINIKGEEVERFSET